MSPVLLAVLNCISDDMAHMLVGQGVDGLATSALDPHEPRAAQHPEVLRYQRLTHPEARDQLVDEARLFGELRHDGQPRRQRPPNPSPTIS
jgi:hypothetical protein